MPLAAPTACSQPGCPLHAVERGRCSVHRRSTGQRGYGPLHQTLRRNALRDYRPTDPCPRCGEPLGPDPDALDLGHTDDRRGYEGLEHRSCNRGARRSP